MLRLVKALTLLLIFLPPAALGWHEKETYNTDKTIITYDSRDDFYSFEKRLFGELEYLIHSSGPESQRLSKHVDSLYEETEEILGLYPRAGKINIEIFHDNDTFTQAYHELGFSGTPPESFYSSKSRKIYVNVEDIDDYKLAHEMAHSIMCDYFIIPPPSKTQEILARYVERKLSGD